MTVARRQKREKAPANKLFTELFFEFIQVFSENSIEEHGNVFVDPIVWEKLQKLDNRWRYFCNKPGNLIKKSNYKKEFKNRKEPYFKIDYLINEVNTYVDRFTMLKLDKYIKKYMHTIEIPDANFLKEIPSEMEELSQEQFIGYAAEMAKLFAGDQSIDDFKTNLVFKFLDIKHSRKKYAELSKLSKLEIGENVYRVADLLDYFFEIDEEKVKVNLSWTKNFIRRIGWILRGPENALTDITFQEYKDANNFFRDYSKTKSEESLNRLVAVLYRPKFLLWKWRYKPGWFFEKRSKLLSRVPFAKRFGVYLFYSACEEFLRTGTFQADGTDINLKILYEQTVKEKKLQDKVKYKDDTGLTGLAYSLAKTGIYGDVQKVFNQNLYDVLVLLYQQRIEYLNQLENLDV